MPPILNARNLSKAFGAEPLFRGVSFTVNERDRIALIGPNGSGKSTLLRILAGLVPPDEGEVALRKRARLAYVPQESNFEAGRTVRQVIEEALKQLAITPLESDARLHETLGRAGFEDFADKAAALSGGWRKRLAIAEALVTEPDILLLDEPTNHLDLAGIEWLEQFLAQASYACVVVSHDRYFLENVASETAELARIYPDGIYRVSGTYSQFLEEKEQWMHTQAKQQESLENRVRNEIDWLRRGPKARAGKSKSRIDRAHELIGQLDEMRDRSKQFTTDLDFSATDRKTKRLLEVEGLSYNFSEERPLLNHLDFVVTNGMRVGLVGPNGSGKTTLLRLLQGELAPQAGTIRTADHLKIVYFEQHRTLPPDVTLRRALAPDSDAVVFQDRVIHVAAWAERFLFTAEQLNQPVSRLSGGERARVLIARLMLQPADILLLDEPTNDLDIPTLEVLEETLLEFRGAILLVTHDRYLLDRVSTTVLGLDGRGNAARFADYQQWEEWKNAGDAPSAKKEDGPTEAQETKSAAPAKKKLSYMEAREYAAIEQQIAEAEARAAKAHAAMNDPAIQSDAEALLAAHAELQESDSALDKLITRWTELEEKLQ
ncbi:MAG: ABC-F family ATP-binding cassette domain-containing protein [Acidobacteriota bacterium]|nr:ABC-F family ATP-binding cassette domain-containing protein [Acidobacteriota bacterium]